MKSVWGAGNEVGLLLSLAQAHAGQPAAAQAISDWLSWKPGSLAVRRRIP